MVDKNKKNSKKSKNAMNKFGGRKKIFFLEFFIFKISKMNFQS
jgi:hypothetical protein